MVRDWAVIKEVLEKAEGVSFNGDSFSQVFPECIVDGNYKKDEETASIRYHLKLLSDSGFVIATFGLGPHISGLTWEGHDLLAKMRSAPANYR